MKRIKSILLVTLISGFSSCIDFFHPNLGNSINEKIIVDGQISDQEGYQSVYVSTTSTIDKPNYKPLSFCNVEIIDNYGNIFKLSEVVSERGHYRVWIGKEFLKPGKSYQVKIITASGIEIISDFEKMQECPKIDSLYFFRKDYPSRDPNKTIQGIQFYVNLNRGNTGSNYFRWEIEETWEHHAIYPITWFVNDSGRLVHNPFPDYSRLTCWTTEKVKNIFAFSAININQSNLMAPLHYVDNQTQRLTYCYSVLLTQYAISENAYKFWNELKKNSSDQGGLYSTQPISVKGNLKSITNPEIEVLGFFEASSTVKSKRLLIQKLENIDVLEPSCAPPQIPDVTAKYFIDVGEGKLMMLLNGCVECDYMSGSTVKPSYWPY